MRPTLLRCSCVLLLVATTACAPAWQHAGGTVVMSPAHLPASGDTENAASVAASGRVLFTVPEGWHWVRRGDDVLATRDGVFLQQILVERLHVDQVDQDVGGYPLAVWSSKAWPVRTAKHLTRRFVAGMPTADAAEVLLGSRRNDPSVTDLALRKVVTRTIAGKQAFRAEFDFRLASAEADRWPMYRSVSCGFLLGEWFYGITYTAAARYYFDRDAGTFETFLESVHVEAP
jgi:hypothetical protein